MKVNTEFPLYPTKRDCVLVIPRLLLLHVSLDFGYVSEFGATEYYHGRVVELK